MVNSRLANSPQGARGGMIFRDFAPEIEADFAPVALMCQRPDFCISSPGGGFRLRHPQLKFTVPVFVPGPGLRALGWGGVVCAD
jgi:hypothetical protein